MIRRLAAAAVAAVLVAVGALLPAAALAQGTPFSPPQPLIPPSAPDPRPVPIAPGRESDDNDGLGTTGRTLVVLAGVALVGGIAGAIIIDARRRRPVTEEDMRPGRAAAAAAGHDTEHRRALNKKRRARARTARESRKKNRPKRK